MRARKLYILIISAFFTLQNGLFADPVSPVGSGRVPAGGSARGRSPGLIRTPSPGINSSNQLITGNVQGNKYFRGVVPYNSESYFSGDVPSADLDNFLRRSSGGGYTDRNPGSYEPYYSPSRSVTSMRPGTRDLFKPGSVAPVQKPKSEFLPRPPSDYFVRKDYEPQRPLSRNLQELQEIVVEGYRLTPGTVEQEGQQELTQQQKEYQLRLKEFQQNLEAVSAQAEQLRQELIDDTDQPVGTESEPAGILRNIQKASEQQQEQARFDIEPFSPESLEPGRVDFADSDVYTQMRLIAQAQQQVDRLERLSQQQQDEPRQIETEKMQAALARAKESLGTIQTFAKPLQGDKFNQHMAMAERYLDQGEYYKAADSYSLAGLYKPNDPLVNAGKSHALFAAGEYLSSALYLSRTLIEFEQYAEFDIDLISLVGGRDILDKRIADIKEWIQKSDAVELKFLLGYVYYQMGRFDLAGEYIDQAYEQEPDFGPINAVKRAVDAAKSRQ